MTLKLSTQYYQVCSNDGPWVDLTKFVQMMIHGLTLKLSTQYYQVCSNDGPWVDLTKFVQMMTHGLTLNYFTARANLVPYVFEWEKGKTVEFLETIVVYDVKVVRCS